MHIALLASDGLSPTEISRVLFCSRTTVYAVASRFVREGRAAFDDREGAARGRCSGRRRTSASRSCSKRTPPSSMAGCARAGAASSSPCNFQREARGGEPGDGSPRAPSAGVPLEEAAPRRARERILRGADRGEARQARRCPANDGGGRPLSSRTRPSWRPTPRWASAGCEKGDRGL